MGYVNSVYCSNVRMMSAHSANPTCASNVGAYCTHPGSLAHLTIPTTVSTMHAHMNIILPMHALHLSAGKSRHALQYGHTHARISRK